MRRLSESVVLLKMRILPVRVFIVSYPKSGRTWLRALIGKALCDQYDLPAERMLQSEFVTVAARLPKTEFTHDGSAMALGADYRTLSCDTSKYEGKKVILLTRGVKDTLVSAYFQATRRGNAFRGSMSEFIRDPRFGAMKVLTFYRRWAESAETPRDFLAMSYEDLHADTAAVTRKALEFIGVEDIRGAVVQAAVKYCSFGNLRRAEAANRFATPMLAPRQVDDPETFKVRKGKVGNYGEYLSEENIRYIDGLVAAHGSRFARP